MSDPVNGVPVTSLLERVLLGLRAELYALSAARFPGLRARHYRLLTFLPPAGERLSRVAAVSGLTKQALAQTLRPLEDGGYVVVGPDPADRRARVVRLTDRGREVVEAVGEQLGAVERRWAAAVGPERYATARAVLGEVIMGGHPPSSGAP
ncbi:DNA-binding transcriptional regulator, MarR family [Klenkia soli]|uniref:DNA-binding transcriptional regulator, MarR family n=1 Tax=Klenkia soli TaxID=1052260 RepID=A0A1H0R5T3_9ACTN|nr:MarR family winged helix-turn-helix transcriptional regulator [Klenkia soli]SDP24902.1 DNA-binding transcriptional regulator, MarR family [Klenkia soli]